METLLEREHVLDESICAKFEKATGSLGEYSDAHYSRGEKEFIGISKLLYKKDCIPAETIGKAFVIAAWKGESELVTLLRSDSRISALMVDEAFAAAAMRKESDLMMSLYFTNISADAILAAFSNAAPRGTRTLSESSFTNSLMSRIRSQEFKSKAFVIAAQLRRDAVLELLCDSVDGNWPLAILQEALAVAEHDEVKNLIRKVICDQLFDPNFDGLVGMVSKFMEARVTDPFSSALEYEKVKIILLL